MERLELSQLPEGARIHFIGIGGISMSGLAEIMLQKGYCVTGSDRTLTHITEHLQSLGATVYEGHDAANIDGQDLVVHTAAVHDDNPEMAAAKAQGLRLVDRAELLGAVMRLYNHAVGVAGTHGKTTTTSMLAYTLIGAGLDPTISLGGELDYIGGNVRTGHSPYFVTEACEYTNSFLKFFPTVAVITNIEEDHLDFFSGIDEIIESFRAFAELTRGKGVIIANGTDENVRRALEGTGLEILTYGIDTHMDYYADKIEYTDGRPSFDVIAHGKKLTHVCLGVLGEHNILNALAAIAVSDILGVDIDKVAAALGEFRGTHRRFELVGAVNGAAVIDDYAHHPTEIRATLSAVKRMPHNKVYCIFQPHTYSRTRTLWNEFSTAFDDADELILTDIYAAREQFDGVTRAETLAEEIAARGKSHVRYIKEFADIEDVIKREVREGDVVFTMGAGTVTKIGYELNAQNRRNPL